MKNVIIILMSSLFWGCTSDTKPQDESIHTGNTFKNEIDSTTFICKEKLDSLNLRDAYDTCKFWLYCYGSDRKVYFKDKYPHKDSFTLFPCFDLDCESINVLNDTVEFLFRVILDDSLEIDWRRVPVPQGILYKLSESRPIGIILDGPMRYLWSSNPRSRANNPLQPDIIKFIQANHSLFNPWFVERLKERKIVK